MWWRQNRGSQRVKAANKQTLYFKMLKTILAYILAFIAAAFLSRMLGLLLFPLALIGRKVKALAPVATFLTSAGAMFIVIILFIWLCGKMQVQPTYLMFLLPYLAVLRGGFKRIDAAKKGNTTVERMAGDDYNAALQVRMEYGYLIGDVVGLFLPLFVLNRLPFI